MPARNDVRQIGHVVEVSRIPRMYRFLQASADLPELLREPLGRMTGVYQNVGEPLEELT